MLRAAWLSAQNDVRLLVKDPVVILMLLLAPVVIITVAGYSLGPLYGGGAHARPLPVVDDDRGEVAARLLAALDEEPAVRVERLGDLDAARRLVNRSDGPPLALGIPAGTSAAVRAGRPASLVAYVDPAKRIEADAVKLRVAALASAATTEIRAAAQARLDATVADLRQEIDGVVGALDAERARIRAALETAHAAATDAVRVQLTAAAARAGREIAARIRDREQHAWATIEAALAARRARVDDLRARLADLRASEAAFRDWLARLRELAGRHADDLPPPPSFPTLPSDEELAALTEPIARPPLGPSIAVPLPAAEPTIAVPPIDPPETPAELERLREVRVDPLPGILGFREEPASPDADVKANAFDQYVPGFGVTFLLIGMMLGIALTLVDERSWGTIQRLEASGVPLSGLLLGKLLTRFAVGVLQMVVLFGVGRALFGISLGPSPGALLLPTVGISFAAAGLGLLMPTLARAHDSVMPLGTMVSMAMSAIGGCWWPLDFEPSWMRAVARALPTTWTMQAYNDLMIRRMTWDAAVRPTLMTLAIGLLYVAIGIAANVRVRERRGP